MISLVNVVRLLPTHEDHPKTTPNLKRRTLTTQPVKVKHKKSAHDQESRSRAHVETKLTRSRALIGMTPDIVS